MRIAVYPCRAQLYGARSENRTPDAGYESAALPIELTRPLTGASSQSLTGLPGIQILRIDSNAYEAILTQEVLPLDDAPHATLYAMGMLEERLDSNQDLPAAWSGIPDSNWCMQTGSLPSWPLDEYRVPMERSMGVQPI